jgi:DNA-binding response OmpR family regulator
VHILVGTDADHVLNDVTAALGGPDVSFTVCRNGRDVSDVVSKRTPDLVVLDLQIGSMGGMAVTMSLRLDESSGRLPHVRVLMLLDRQADIHLAKRCAADAYLVKPLNPLSLKRAARAILHPIAAPTEPIAEESPEEEPAPVG